MSKTHSFPRDLQALDKNAIIQGIKIRTKNLYIVKWFVLLRGEEMGLEEEAVQKKHNRVMIYTIFWSLVFVVVVIYLNASQTKTGKRADADWCDLHDHEQ